MVDRRRLSSWLFLALVALLSAFALWLPPVVVRKPRAALVPHAVTVVSHPAVAVWLSTEDRRLRMAREPDVQIEAPTGVQPDIAINVGRTYQTITGFGAALTDASALLIHRDMSAAQRHALLEDLFGPPPGLGFNMMRLTIGASDFSPQRYTLDDMPAGQVDPDLSHFNIAADLTDLLPTLHDVLAINPHLHIVASTWSAPAWMKNPATLIGGTLLPEYESAFAQYLVRYVQAFHDQGVPIWALTLQNEPTFGPVSYPGMLLDPATRARIIGQYLGPALAARHPRTLILGWDHNWNEPEQPLAVLSDPTAESYIAGVAWHCYGGSPTAQSKVHRAYPHKDVYLTECSGGAWAEHGELLWAAHDLLLASLRNWARGVVYWNLALDEHYGPHLGGCGNCKGVVVIDSKTGAVSHNDEYYAFAHFSRFVRPGAVRVWSTPARGELDNVAFRNADHGSLVLVVTNSDKQAREVSVVQGAIAFHYRLPAESVATFVWSPNPLPPSHMGTVAQP